MSKDSLPQSRLKELLNYDEKTGVFTWVKNAGSKRSGSIAGCVNVDGYTVIHVDNNDYYAHRLAYLFMTGEFPKGNIDHKNGVKGCNVWGNLRECTDQQNKFNIGLRKDNTSGFKGVSWCKLYRKWAAQASLNGKVKHLGRYATAEQASDAYKAFVSQNHGDFLHKSICH